MTGNHYNVVNVEDKASDGAIVKTLAESGGATSYHRIGTLEELKSILETHSADIWVVDGDFPDNESSMKAVYNAGEAVKLIIETYGTEIPVIVFSGHADESEKVAAQYGVRFILKSMSAIDELKALFSGVAWK